MSNQNNEKPKYLSSREQKMTIKSIIFTDKLIRTIKPLGFALLSYLLNILNKLQHNPIQK